MAPTDETIPSQPLRPLSRYPKPAAWGFLLDDHHIASLLKEQYDAICAGPEDISIQSSKYMKICEDFYSELINKCNEITKDEPRATHRFVRVKGQSYEENAIAFTWHTRPDDKLIPSPEKV
ncbi:hypothetical protein CPB84DRAFT_1848891 [Gymnopilus junonius]|uniref:Uncharacterized protein n=1 Tax=Gymnopilus junonius TaxID=109634 RepID=A0A9P5NK28_GYMJU|nr:hypothetical protein CPB84DRAFT_1848891 [Gymnopilus junonius]